MAQVIATSEPAVPELVWWAIGATEAGASRQRSATPCQDAFGLRSLPGGGLIGASADGAGFAARSVEGAVCAVEAVLAARAPWSTRTRPI